MTRGVRTGFALVLMLSLGLALALPVRAESISQADIDKAKKLFQQYKNQHPDGPSIPTGDGSSGSPLPAADGDGSVAPGTGVIEPEPGSKRALPPEDLRFCTGHMKLAKRHFGLKNIPRAKEELVIIFERAPDFPPARFMRAVIAAKEKEFIEAWRNIDVAQKGDPENPKIKEFIDRLQKASPKPDVLPDAAPAARPVPSFASQMAIDAVERLLADKAVATKVTRLTCGEYADRDGKPTARLTLQGNAAFDTVVIETAIKEITKGEVKIIASASEGKELDIHFELPGMPLTNPAVQPASDLAEFLESVSEETDVAIQNSSESEPDGEKRTTGTYSLAAKGAKNLNDFLRKCSPNTTEYSLLTYFPTVFSGKSIWKGDAKVIFQLAK